MRPDKLPLWCDKYEHNETLLTMGYRPANRCKYSGGSITFTVNTDLVSVCGGCKRPHRQYFRNRLRHCSQCLALFDAPTGDLCRHCSPAFTGWRWLTKYLIEYEKKHLTQPIRPVIVGITNSNKGM